MYCYYTSCTDCLENCDRRERQIPKFPLLSIITVISSFEQNPTCYPNLTFATIGTLIISWLDNFYLEFRGSFSSQDEGDTMRSLLIVELRAIRLIVIKNVALSSSHDIPTPTPSSSTMALEHPETNSLVPTLKHSFHLSTPLSFS